MRVFMAQIFLYIFLIAPIKYVFTKLRDIALINQRIPPLNTWQTDHIYNKSTDFSLENLRASLTCELRKEFFSFRWLSHETWSFVPFLFSLVILYLCNFFLYFFDNSIVTNVCALMKNFISCEMLMKECV